MLVELIVLALSANLRSFKFLIIIQIYFFKKIKEIFFFQYG